MKNTGKINITSCLLLAFSFTLSFYSLRAEPFSKIEPPIKNVIILIPDGCSTDLLPLAKWVQHGIPPVLDKKICALLRTYCSDAPIGDSAPTGSTYACGHRSKDGYIATYPDTTMLADGTRVATDTAKAFNPMFSIMEAARLNGMKTGLVFTCYLPHATPASFLAHTPRRSEYFRITKQMVHQACDVVLGGGSYYIDSSFSSFGFDAREILAQKNIAYTKSFSDWKAKADKGSTKIWGLFAPMDMAYEIDRNPNEEPSLEEMTRAALEVLSKQQSNDKADTSGFLLMVEGSKIDWAAHNNDLAAIVKEFLAFDKAAGVAIDFAVKDKQTLVMIMPDHQTGGLQFGSKITNPGYSKLSVEEMVGNIKKYKKSFQKTVEELWEKADKADIRKITQEEYNISLSEEDLNDIVSAFKQYKRSAASVRIYSDILNKHTTIGFTTHGHTGGYVFLAMYHPRGERLSGVVDNDEIAPYILTQLGWGNISYLDSLSNIYYSKVDNIKKWDKLEVVYSLQKGDKPKKRPNAPYAENKISSGLEPLYIELKFKKNVYKLYPNTDYMEKNGKTISAGGMVIYNGLNFYAPVSCFD